MAKGDNIQERLITFAVGIISLCGKLPKNYVGNHVAGQMLRSGTSPAPNYGEARGAESTKDFVHKLRIVLKELNETGIWLEIIRRSKLLSETEINSVVKECDELCRITRSSIQTASKGKA